MGIIDTHSHYNDEAFDEDRDELLAGLPGKGIDRIVNIAVDIESSKECIALADKYDYIYATVGVHPSNVHESEGDYIEQLKNLAKHDKVVAIAEIGLDYYWSTEYKEKQKEDFVSQLDLAKELGLTAVIHSRDAAKDSFDILKAYAKDLNIVMHCYSYSLEMAKEYLKLGFFFGIGGVATYKNSHKLKEVIEYLPMESMVLETDCPYLSPVPFRGKRNESSYIPYIVNAISDIKAFSPEYVIEKTSENAHRLYPKLR
jgi:hydrolase, tatD family